VEDEPVHERLSRARETRGETPEAIGRRIGVGARLLIAIEEGRFADLPGGFYTRAAIRRYAAALGFDADEVLALCEPHLPATEDPVAALARLRGLKPAAPERAPVDRAAARVETPSGPAPFPPWRPLAAVAIDGVMVAAVLVAAIAGTVQMSGADSSSFGRTAAPVFASMGVLLGCCYFLCFGGIACATAGERLIGMRVGRRHPRHVDPRMMAARAWRCAARDVRYLLRLGEWAGATMWSGRPDESSRAAASAEHATSQ
jgi:hypothetical protein